MWEAVSSLFMRDEQPYLRTKRQAARYLNISIPTLERLIKSGAGPTYTRIGLQMRFRPEDLAVFVEANSRGSQSTAPVGGLGAST